MVQEMGLIENLIFMLKVVNFGDGYGDGENSDDSDGALMVIRM